MTKKSLSQNEFQLIIFDSKPTAFHHKIDTKKLFDTSLPFFKRFEGILTDLKRLESAGFLKQKQF